MSPARCLQTAITLARVTEPNQRSGLRRAVDWIRRAVAALLLTALLALAAISYSNIPGTAVCRDEADSTSSTIRLCGPVGLEDVPAITLGVLVALLLVFPDLDELTIPGIASLKRRVDATEKRQDALQAQLTQMAFQQTNVNIYTPPAQAVAETEEKLEAIRKGRPVEPSSASFATAVPEPDRAVLESTVLRHWEAIAEYQRLAQLRPDVTPSDRIREWEELFGPQIRDLHTLRNTVAHRPDNLSVEQLQDAVRLGEQLLRAFGEIVGSSR